MRHKHLIKLYHMHAVLRSLETRTIQWRHVLRTALVCERAIFPFYLTSQLLGVTWVPLFGTNFITRVADVGW